MISLYNDNTTQPFVFSAWKALCKWYGIDGVLVNQHSLLSTVSQKTLLLIDQHGHIIQVDQQGVNTKTDAILMQHNILLGVIGDRSQLKTTTQQQAYNHFCHEILLAEFNEYKQFFYQVIAYLSTRYSQGKPITEHSAVRIELSKCIESMMLLDTMLADDIGLEQLLCMSTLLLTGIKTLAMCAGGRSVIGGNILELFWVFSLCNHFLLRNIQQ